MHHGETRRDDRRTPPSYYFLIKIFDFNQEGIA